jgi:hypothetical protein
MEIPARYYAKMKDGTWVYVCSHHLSKIAVKLNGSGRLRLRRGVRFMGRLAEHTSKKCGECRK